MDLFDAPRTQELSAPPRIGAPVLDLVIPVYDEEAGLERAVRAARTFLDTQFPYPARLTIADNASTDATLPIARRLADELHGVRVVHLDAKGRGRALHTAWLGSDAAVLAYMDVDLSTDLGALLPLVAPLVSGHSHLAIGTRLSRTSRVVRGPRRELISRAYNLVLRGALAARFSDAQCGFKAIRADAARELLPLVADTGWFFDTELLVLAERANLRIHEVPVDWVDDPDSRVDVVATAKADLRGVVRVGRDLAAGRIPLADLRAHLPLVGDARPVTPVEPGNVLLRQLVRFALVGVASTLAYVVLYALLAGPMGAQVANVVALLLTAVANTAANRRLTFGVRGAGGVLRHHGQGLAVFGLAWALTASSLAVLHATTAPPRALELAVLVAANLLATVLRFLLLRSWVFRPAPTPVTPSEGTLR
ncbi:bifunctional glycosyltransferase family 2/GtrA family protein [Cellulomonas sp. JH27-2]|uniref:bifunctional glycosyltransferase family 2/GtrA family protein n=1 Tax=Cellulomonas sp. JH27-2 TaxID=2774139 RepID=UPI0017825630|nr:bifunctional glycosyltransferase family 2/GtrA family protein [Cellulomonas sp. JH27-2]MBD8059327.1 bifunctional glycosyltransferase family 2/GtrA family protein [Cellulomonas sp. JH27-2]